MAKKLWHLGNQCYNCEKDARKALKNFNKTLKYHVAENIEIVPIQKYPSKGAPKKGTQKQTVGYKIEATLTPNKERIRTLLSNKSHFIRYYQLDANILPDEEILREYKGQQRVERGFAFIKDNTFEVSSVFLKKQTRIAALMAVMVLSLFVYSLTQYLFRDALKNNDEFMPSQIKKPIQNPTAKWIFFLFRNVQILHIKGSMGDLKQKVVVNLTPLLERLIDYLGEETMAIYASTMSTPQ